MKEKRNNLVIYKYNKYTPINGSLFYGFEYAFTTEAKYIIIVPKTFKNKKEFYSNKNKIEYIFSQKYDKDILEDMKNHILYMTETEFINHVYKYDYHNTLIISTNTLLDSILSEIVTNGIKQRLINGNQSISKIYSNLGNILVVLNRKFNTLTFNQKEYLTNLILLLEKNSNEDIDIKFIYEHPCQRILRDPTSPTINQKRCSLKLGIHMFKPLTTKNKTLEDLFTKKDKSQYIEKNVIISGFIPTYILKTFEYPIIQNKIKYNIIQKPTNWCHVRGKSNFFDDIDEVWYYRDHINFDENNRLLVEADAYNIKIVMKDINKLEKDFDSTFERHQYPMEFHMANDDYILSTMRKCFKKDINVNR